MGRVEVGGGGGGDCDDDGDGGGGGVGDVAVWLSSALVVYRAALLCAHRFNHLPYCDIIMCMQHHALQVALHLACIIMHYIQHDTLHGASYITFSITPYM